LRAHKEIAHDEKFSRNIINEKQTHTHAQHSPKYQRSGAQSKHAIFEAPLPLYDWHAPSFMRSSSDERCTVGRPDLPSLLFKRGGVNPCKPNSGRGYSIQAFFKITTLSQRG
jgi:hypothetical protein